MRAHVARLLIAKPHSAGFSFSRSLQTSSSKVTLPALAAMYRNKEPISALTVCDYPSGRIADAAGVDLALVGDSLAMVWLGHTHTNDLSLEVGSLDTCSSSQEMLMCCRAARRGVSRPLLVADMPFGYSEVSPEKAVHNAVRMIKEGHVEGVKIEGGKYMAPTIAKLTSVGIPVLGHVGLTPQTSVSVGGFKVQGRTASAAHDVLQNAIAVQNAGCFGVVLEAVPADVATVITEQLRVPTIGIGAGTGTSGQILVQLDMLGASTGHVPRFVKKYADSWRDNVSAVQNYVSEVKSRRFPDPSHIYTIEPDELKRFKSIVQSGLEK